MYMFDMIDTNMCLYLWNRIDSLLQEFSKTKESTLRVVFNVDSAFYFVG